MKGHYLMNFKIIPHNSKDGVHLIPIGVHPSGDPALASSLYFLTHHRTVSVFSLFTLPCSKVTRRPAFGGIVPIFKNLSRVLRRFKKIQIFERMLKHDLFNEVSLLKKYIDKEKVKSWALAAITT